MIGVYNYLGGKNLCNIVANITVRKIEELFPNAETDISVINVGNFFIVKGSTSSDKVINVAQSVQEILKSHNEDLSNKIKVIDTVIYNKPPKDDVLNISFTYSKNIKKYKKTLNELSKNKTYLNLYIDECSKVIHYCEELFNEKIDEDSISKHFENFNLIEKKYSNDTFISDRFYGLSKCNEKYYHIILMNITHHLFSLSISDYVNISINSINKIDDLDNLNINLNLNDTKCVVKKEWLESLLLDVFPFSVGALKEYISVDLKNEFEYLIGSEETPYWENVNLAKEFVLL